MKHLQAISQLKERRNQVVTSSILDNISNAYYMCKNRNACNTGKVGSISTKSIFSQPIHNSTNTRTNIINLGSSACSID